MWVEYKDNDRLYYVDLDKCVAVCAHAGWQTSGKWVVNAETPFGEHYTLAELDTLEDANAVVGLIMDEWLFGKTHFLRLDETLITAATELQQ